MVPRLASNKLVGTIIQCAPLVHVCRTSPAPAQTLRLPSWPQHFLSSQLTQVAPLPNPHQHHHSRVVMGQLVAHLQHHRRDDLGLESSHVFAQA